MSKKLAFVKVLIFSLILNVVPALSTGNPALISDWTIEPGIIPDNGTQMAGAAAIDDFVFLMGGFNNTEHDTDDVVRWRVDLFNGLLSLPPDMMPPLPNVGNFSYIFESTDVSTPTRTIYIAGGGWNDHLSPNRRNVTYAHVDLAGNLPPSWSQSADFPNGYDPELGGAIVCNGYLYAFGGDSESGVPLIYDSCYYAHINPDGSLGVWQTGTTLPDVDGNPANGTGWWFPAVTAVGSYIIAQPGIQSTRSYLDATDNLYVCHVNADGSMGPWVEQTGAHLPSPRYNTELLNVGNTVFAIGGRDLGGVAQNYVGRAQFDPATGTLGAWTTVDAQLPDGVRYHDVVFSPASKRLYVVGIRRASDLAVSNEAYISSPLFPSDTLVISPSEGFVASGPEGGPFAPTSKTYTLTNTGTETLEWTASLTQTWVTNLPINGTLASGASVDVVVSINTNANSLAPGYYTDTITFTNTDSGLSQERGVRLTVRSTSCGGVFGVQWATFLGGNNYDEPFHIAADNLGNVFITGWTSSSDFPTSGAYDYIYNGGSYDVFIAKFREDGHLCWSTFLGGSAEDRGWGITVTNNGFVYVTGTTLSSDFPVPEGYDTSYNGGQDAFVAKFTTNGALVWSTYLGGTNIERGQSIITDESDVVYITGYTASMDFPTLNAYCSTMSGVWDAFVTKLDANGSLIWSTYLGGYAWDEGRALTLDPWGNLGVTGGTGSYNFPTLNGFQMTKPEGNNAFVSKFSPTGSLLWSTYLGGAMEDAGWGIVADAEGCFYVTGDTTSSDFPTSGAFDSSFNGVDDAFVTKFSASGYLIWSTYLGGSDSDPARDISSDGLGHIFVLGRTLSTDFPIIDGYDSTPGGARDVYIAKFDTMGSLLWSSYLGGSGDDYGRGIAAAGEFAVYVSGETNSSDFPVVNAFDNSYGGNWDCYVAKYACTNTCTLTVNATHGSVARAPDLAEYDCGTTVSLTATPDTGYHFTVWSGDVLSGHETDNPLVVTMDSYKTLTANFDINTFTLTYTAGANGSISGVTLQTVNYGADGAAVEAVPATGYHFVKWSDDSTDNPRTDTDVIADISVTATFAINVYTVTFLTDSTAGATLIGTTTQMVNHGADCTAVTANAPTNYRFVKWTKGIANYSTANPLTVNNVTENMTLKAIFASGKPSAAKNWHLYE